MYSIQQKTTGQWHCECVIQDGTERWDEDTREAAVRSLIRAARTLNGSYITEKDINFKQIKPEVLPQRVVSEDEWELLTAIKNRSKIVLDYNDLRVLYRILPEECEMIVKIREGDLIVVTNQSVARRSALG